MISLSLCHMANIYGFISNSNSAVTTKLGSILGQHVLTLVSRRLKLLPLDYVRYRDVLLTNYPVSISTFCTFKIASNAVLVFYEY